MVKRERVIDRQTHGEECETEGVVKKEVHFLWFRLFPHVIMYTSFGGADIVLLPVRYHAPIHETNFIK